jgi:hypothetical protein
VLGDFWDAPRSLDRALAAGFLDSRGRKASERHEYSNGSIDASVPFINYDLSLHTTARYFDEDLRIFRAVLSTVRLSPPARNVPAEH